MFTKHSIFFKSRPMKNILALFVFFTATTTSPFALSADAKKETKSAVHKIHTKNVGCRTKGGSDRSKKDNCCSIDSKKDFKKTEKVESENKSEKK